MPASIESGSLVTTTSSPGIFVGREREMGLLVKALGRAKNGVGDIFVLTGEAGIGKTRLAEELTSQARTDGFEIAWARCWEGGGAPPLWPWLQVGEALRLKALEDFELDRSSQEFFDAYRALLTVLQSASDTAPTVVVIDDAHAADRGSIEFLKFLRPALRSLRLLVVLTFRTGAGIEGPDRSLLGTIIRESRHVELQRLSRSATSALLEAETGGPSLDTVVAAVHHATEGNPFFVQEMGKLLTSPTGLSRPDFSMGFNVPEGTRDLIDQRLGSIPDDALEVLEVASVLGTEFDAAFVARLEGVTTEEALARLGRSSSVGIVKEIGSPARYRFEHVLIREALYEGLSPERRSRLHARAASILEELTDRSLAQATQLADHAFKAGDSFSAQKTLAYTHKAALALGAAGEADQARRLRHRALKTAERTGTSERDRDELRRELDAAIDDQATHRPIGAATLQREGDVWLVGLGDATARIKHSKGLDYLRILIRACGRDLHVLELVDSISHVPAHRRTDPEELNTDGSREQPILDERARSQLRARLTDLQGTLEEARAYNDLERAAHIESELEAVTNELAAGLGLGGRDRHMASSAERARVSVTKAVRAAIKRIDAVVPELGDHLSASIRTGAFCSYDPPRSWMPDWSL